MTVHAHPDDETIGTGGTMATSVRAGRRVVLVTCTRGEMGEIVVPDMDTPDNHRRLGEMRAAELEQAMGALGVTEWENLGYRDSDMMGRSGNLDARSFWQANLDEAIGRLVFLVRTYRPDVMTTYNDFGGYGHPDHIRAHQLTMAAATDVDRVFHAVTSRAATEAGAAALAEIPDLPWRLPEEGELPVTDDAEITTAIDISEHLVAKLRALRAHSTQISVWQDGVGRASYALSNGIAQPVAQAEYYVLAKGPAEGAETDLFGGLD
jgi:N-acetyl-1-D-myo-inositol-2-amino-2-deoxy-alpha-D-glucopyranoside deacetylase